MLFIILCFILAYFVSPWLALAMTVFTKRWWWAVCFAIILFAQSTTPLPL